MRILAPLSLVVALAAGTTLAAGRQDAAQAPVVQPPPTAPPVVPIELSDLLTHSPLALCNTSAATAVPGPTHLRIATWNIQAARSAPVNAIAAELQAMQADLVALQEVDVRVRRTGFVDEPADLAADLKFQYAFAASIKWDEGDYGIAVLSRWPLVSVKRYRLDATEASEPRIALEVVVCVDGRPLRLVDHHADRRAPTRAADFAQLRGIVQPDLGNGVLLLGDFNERPDGPDVRGLIDAGFVDLAATDTSATVGFGRIDYVLADGPLARLASNVRVWPTDKSDHNAVVADLNW